MTGWNNWHEQVGPVNHEWRQHANCHGIDPDVFFPERGQDPKPILAICAACPVRDECLQYAIDHHQPDGIWGGTTGRQRRTMKSARNKQSRAA